ncbi:hypothetical protein ACIGB8_10530 [Promicromonospora sukumoe]|uniref:hypothetical protein n=1 Tax=Promicromonospora sukumoe TaxID=88382 RepID=UPI0037C8E9C6
MVALKTTVEDMRNLLGYLNKQIGWVEITKVNRALGSIDERKLRAMSEFGLIERDGSNLRLATIGTQFASGDEAGSLQQVIRRIDLYRETVEWIHYGSRSEITATEIGQYWEARHKESVGELKGSTLNGGAVTFGRVVQGAGLGALTLGRAGKSTRLAADLSAIESFVENAELAASGDESLKTNLDEPVPQSAVPEVSAALDSSARRAAIVESPADARIGAVRYAASPSVHVNVEVHIAADATADTVREIFKNMARYVLDKPVVDDGDI